MPPNGNRLAAEYTSVQYALVPHNHDQPGKLPILLQPNELAILTFVQLDELLEEAGEIQRLPLPPDERHPSSSHHTGRIRSSHYRCRINRVWRI